MFQPDRRLLLTEALRPPSGYTLDRAVGSTFTLDLTAALAAPLSLGAQRWGATSDPITIMESVRAVADRIDVFCQAGMINVPASASDLVAFLEPMVHEVTPPRSHALFHPKVWVLRFLPDDPDQPVKMRLLCGSRNLTLDRSWDLMVQLDGEVAGKRLGWNEPLAALLTTLPDLAIAPLASTQLRGIQSLADDVRTTEWETPAGFEDCYFYALGIDDEDEPYFEGYHHLVISPFVNDAGLARVAEGGRGGVLISRPEEIDRLDPEWLDHFATYTLDPGAGLADDTDDEPQPQQPADSHNPAGLHAKAVIVDHYRAFLGSMNATNMGVDGNVEFVVELTTKRGRLSPKKLLDPNDESSFRQLLTEYTPPDGVPPEPEDWSLENDLRTAASREYTVRAAGTQNGWQLALTVDETPSFPDTEITVALHSRRGLSQSLNAVPVVFGALELADITPFVVLTLERSGEQRSTIVRATLINDPSDRLDAVLARQIDSPEKLMRFIMLVLQLATGGETDIDLGEATGGDGWWGTAGTGGLLETVAVALAKAPEALDDVDRLISRLETTDEGRATMPPGLSELWAEVRTARKRLARQT